MNNLDKMIVGRTRAKGVASSKNRELFDSICKALFDSEQVYTTNTSDSVNVLFKLPDGRTINCCRIALREGTIYVNSVAMDDYHKILDKIADLVSSVKVHYE